MRSKRKHRDEYNTGDLLLLLALLNGELSIEDDWEDPESSLTLTSNAKKRIVALIRAFSDIEADIHGTLPADYPREASSSFGARSLADLVPEVLAEMQAERDDREFQHWPRPPRPPLAPGIEGTPICWGEANAILADYSSTTKVRRSLSSLETDSDGMAIDAWEIEEEDSGTRPRLEFRLVKEVVKLARNGLLPRLRVCDCGQWFYAFRADQHSHGSNCRQRKHSKTEEFKMHRREYMRWYYAMYQSPKVPRKKIAFTKWKELNTQPKRG